MAFARRLAMTASAMLILVACAGQPTDTPPTMTEMSGMPMPMLDDADMDGPPPGGSASPEVSEDLDG